MQITNLTNGDMSVYVKDLMKLPKNLNELIYMLQRNITQAQFNRQFAAMGNRASLTPTQAQIMALADKDLDERVKANRVKACEEVIEKDRKLQEKLK